MSEILIRKAFISIEDSRALYGVAILFMIFHHCFCIPARLGYNYVPVLGGFEIESRIAYIGRLCVAIYAFITGYALAVKAKGIHSDNVLIRLKTDVLISVRQLWHFYKKFWLVFVIFIPIGILLFNASSSPISLIEGFIFGGGGIT